MAERQRRPHPGLEPELHRWWHWTLQDALRRPRDVEELVSVRDAARGLYRVDGPYGASERRWVEPSMAYLLTLDATAPLAEREAARERALLWSRHGSFAFPHLGFYPALAQIGGPTAAARVAETLGDPAPVLAMGHDAGDALGPHAQSPANQPPADQGPPDPQSFLDLQPASRLPALRGADFA